MGFRFRKSIKIAPGTKINFNKKSIGATFGTKGAHYTINSKGKKTATVGIPGTGLSYSSSSKGETNHNSSLPPSPNKPDKNSHDNNNNKKWYQKTIWIIFWLIFCFPVGLFLMWRYSQWKKIVKIIISALFALCIYGFITLPTLEEATLSANTTIPYDINEKVPIEVKTIPEDYLISSSDYFVTSGGSVDVSDNLITFSSKKPGSYEIYIDFANVKSNSLTITIEDKAAQAKKEAAAKKKAEEEAAAKKKAEEEAAAKKKAEEEAAAKKKAEEEAAAKKKAKEEAAAKKKAEEEAAKKEAEEPKEEMVWISNTGTKYHNNSSCSNMSNPKQVTITEAQNQGRDACKKCY